MEKNATSNNVNNSYMSLQNFFRLITMSVFQKSVSYHFKSFLGGNEPYDNVFFHCPKIVCNDGFSVSFQISIGNYCGTENGYRKLGYSWKEVEFGFPSEEEELLLPYSECEESTINSVGCVPIEVAQQVVDKHGGIDFDKTLSEDAFNRFIK